MLPSSSPTREDFQVNQIDDPTITDPHDVIVRVGVAGFCRTDIHLWLGRFDAMRKGARDVPNFADAGRMPTASSKTSSSSADSISRRQ